MTSNNVQTSSAPSGAERAKGQTCIVLHCLYIYIYGSAKWKDWPSTSQKNIRTVRNTLPSDGERKGQAKSPKTIKRLGGLPVCTLTYFLQLCLEYFRTYLPSAVECGCDGAAKTNSAWSESGMKTMKDDESVWTYFLNHWRLLMPKHIPKWNWEKRKETVKLSWNGECTIDELQEAWGASHFLCAAHWRAASAS